MDLPQKVIDGQRPRTRSQIIGTLLAIDQEINSRTPINKIPTELLIEIININAKRPPTFDNRRPLPFLHKCRNLPKRRNASATEEYDPIEAMIIVTRVCHHWRTIALETPCLWALDYDCNRIPCRWVTELLRRSSHVPVGVSFIQEDSRIHNDLTFVDTVLNLKNAVTDMSKLRHLSLDDFTGTSTTDNGVIARVLTYLQRPALALESFELSCEGLDTHVDLPVPIFQLSPNLFARNAPNLKHLSLGHCIPDFYSPIVQNLRSLKISHLSEASIIPVNRLVEVLQAMSYLEDLHIVGIIPNGSEAVLQPRVQLQSMRSLRLEGSRQIDGYADLLAAFTLPRLTTLFIKCTSIHLPNPKHNTLLNEVSSLLRHQQLGSLPHKLYLKGGRGEFQVGNFVLDREETEEGDRSPFSFHLTLGYSVNQEENSQLPPLTRIVADLLPAFQVCQSIELDLDSTDPNAANTLLQALSAVDMAVIRRYSSTLSTALTSGQAFPSLRRLVLKRSTGFADMQALLQSLVYLVQARGELGIPLQNITFERTFFVQVLRRGETLPSFDEFTRLGVHAIAEQPFPAKVTDNNSDFSDIIFA